MATGTILLDPKSATPPDGSSGNAAPQPIRQQGTETNPKKHAIVYAYDAATAEHLWFRFRMPTDYASGGAVKVQWQANAVTATAVVWASRLGAVTPNDADTPVEHAAAAASTATSSTNTTEARRLTEASITLANLDSVAAGDLVDLVIYRDAANGSDTLAIDAEFVYAAFEYTTT